MTVQRDTGPPGSASEPSKPAQVADRATSEASNVASTAAEGTREVAAVASDQARAVAGQAKQQLDGLVSQARSEVRQQAEQRNQQAAGQLRTLSDQLSALAEGRPDSAGPLVGYLNDANNQVRQFASRLEERGPQGVLDDVTSFARRRPGLFLAGAAGFGFLVGRMMRAGIASQQESKESEQAWRTTAYDTTPSAYATTGEVVAGPVTEAPLTDPLAEPLPPPVQPDQGIRP